MRALFANCRQGTVMRRMSHSLRSDADSFCLFNTPCYWSSLLAGRAEQLLSFPSWHCPAGVYSSPLLVSGRGGCPVLAPGIVYPCSCPSARGIWASRFCPIRPQPWQDPSTLFPLNTRTLVPAADLTFGCPNPVLIFFVEFKWELTKGGGGPNWSWAELDGWCSLCIASTM